MKLDKNGLYKPTPEKMKKLGHAILTAGTSLTTYAAFMNNKTLVITSAIATFIGTLFVDFFTE